MKMSAVKNFTFFSLHALSKYKFSYCMSSSIVPLISYFFISCQKCVKIILPHVKHCSLLFVSSEAKCLCLEAAV